MNTTFDTMDEAYPAIEVALRDQAATDCEGERGQPFYTQAFDVAGSPYTATLGMTYGQRTVPRPDSDGNTFMRTFAYVIEAAFAVQDAAGQVVTRPAQPL